MPVPRNKKSKSKGKMRRAHYNRIELPTLVQCSCQRMIPSHKACPYCGQYKGRIIINVKTVEEKKEKRQKRKEQESEK